MMGKGEKTYEAVFGRASVDIYGQTTRGPMPNNARGVYAPRIDALLPE